MFRIQHISAAQIHRNNAHILKNHIFVVPDFYIYPGVYITQATNYRCY